ncbi:urea ABC transporter [Pararhizobium polonicum]|uniref:Urea ABC transporter n=1 Tax=Pararhizobium polonicum TaxID=1612624 RepID=A0A1C7P0E4_9HYPH|nr:ABC transporter ATP-binding protein [Pararhizobium polonicum]OBZ94783.1 urea ABC transporter [Pararhizobium polonicum]
MTDYLLKAEGVAMHFGGVKALDGIDFRLRKGELRCLIGPNGAGKTTFFRCLTGTQKPTYGTIEFRGRNIAGKERHEIARAGIGIKTQVPSLFDGLTVEENIWLSLRSIRDRRQRTSKIAEVLERVGITDLRNGTLGRMAHGQRQLVELAMVVASDPELILLDEPAAGMTSAEVERLGAIIREVNRSHTVVVVEHDMQFIRMIADQITVFHQGKILVEDQVENILRNQTVRDVYLGKKHVA